MTIKPDISSVTEAYDLKDSASDLSCTTYIVKEIVKIATIKIILIQSRRNALL